MPSNIRNGVSFLKWTARAYLNAKEVLATKSSISLIRSSAPAKFSNACQTNTRIVFTYFCSTSFAHSFILRLTLRFFFTYTAETSELAIILSSFSFASSSILRMSSIVRPSHSSIWQISWRIVRVKTLISWDRMMFSMMVCRPKYLKLRVKGAGQIDLRILNRYLLVAAHYRIYDGGEGAIVLAVLYHSGARGPMFRFWLW